MPIYGHAKCGCTGAFHGPECVFAVRPPCKPSMVDQALTILQQAEGWTDTEASAWLHAQARQQNLRPEVLAGWIAAGAAWPKAPASESQGGRSR